ncbi:MAG: hypothetical protein KA288_07325, partial [Paludibacteraceae bacterium]|nr:hypothetical protein [Paludibacteraceae bacterium]
GKITPIGTNTQKKGLEKTLISKPFLHSHTAYLGCLRRIWDAYAKPALLNILFKIINIYRKIALY